MPQYSDNDESAQEFVGQNMNIINRAGVSTKDAVKITTTAKAFFKRATSTVIGTIFLLLGVVLSLMLIVLTSTGLMSMDTFDYMKLLIGVIMVVAATYIFMMV